MDIRKLIVELELSLDNFRKQVRNYTKELENIKGTIKVEPKINTKKIKEEFSNATKIVETVMKDSNQRIRTITEDMGNGLTKTTKKINNEVKSVTTDIQNLSKTFTSDFNKIKQEIAGLNKTTLSDKELNKYIDKFKELKKSLNLKDGTAEINKLNGEIKKLQSDKFTNAFNKILNPVLDQKATGQFDITKLRKAKSSFEELMKSQSPFSKQYGDIAKALKMVNDEINKIPKTNKVKDDFDEVIQKFKLGKTSLEQYKQQLDKFNEGKSESGRKIKNKLDIEDQIKLRSELEKINKLLEKQNKAKESKAEYDNLKPIRDAENAYKSLNKQQQEQASNIQKVIDAYDNLIVRYGTDRKDITELAIARKKYVDSLSSGNFKTDFNTIMNNYNSLSASGKSQVNSINTTIGYLEKLKEKYKLDTSEYQKLQKQIISLNSTKEKVLSKQLTDEAQRNIKINEEFKKLVDQYATQKITSAEYLDKLNKMNVKSDITKSSPFDNLNIGNQKLYVKELEKVGNSLSKAVDETDKIKIKLSKTQLGKLETQLAQMSLQGQRLPSNIRIVINEIDNVIKKYQSEGRSIDDLLKKKNRYQKQIEDSIKTAQKEADQLLKNNKIVSQMSGVMGSGDRRATIGDKFLNSAVYSASSQFFGMAEQSVSNLIKANSDYELGLVGITRTMNNLSQKDMKDLSNASFELSKKFGIGIGEVQKAMTDLARAGIQDKNTLTQMTESVLLGLNTTEIKDSAEMVKYLVSTVKQLGLQFSDTNKIIDEWNALSDQYAVSSVDFAQAVSKAGASSKILGLTLEDINSMVILLGERTATSGNEIGNAVKTLESYVYRPETIKALEGYGIAIKKNEKDFLGFKDIISQVSQKINEFGDESQATNEILDKLGGAWRKNWINILASSWSGLENINEKQREIAKNSLNQETSYSFKENAKIMETFAKKVEQLKTSFYELAVSIGNSGLLDQLKFLVDGLKSIVNAFESIPEPIQTFLGLAVELNLALLLVGKSLQFLGIQRVEILFGQLASKIGAFNIMAQEGVYQTIGLANAKKYLNDQTILGAISQERANVILDSTRKMQIANNLTTRESVIQTRALAIAMESSRNASVGFNTQMSVTKGLVGVGITAVLMVATMAYSHFAEQSAKADSKLKDSMQTYESFIKQNQDLKDSLNDVAFSTKDASTKKLELTNIENALKENLNDSTDALNFQNKSIKEQLDLLDKLTIEKSKAFITENTSKYEDAKKTLSSKQNVYGGKLTKNIQGDYGLFSLENFNTNYESRRKQYETINKSLSIYKVDSQGIIKLEGTKREIYEKLKIVAGELNLAYANMNDKQKASNKELKILAENAQEQLNDMKDEYEPLIKLVDDYEIALKNVNQAQKGQEFRAKYKEQFDYIDSLIKSTQNKKPLEVKMIFKDVLAFKETWKSLLEENSDQKFLDDLTNFFNDVESGAKKATEGIDSFNEASRAIATFKEEVKPLASAYKEMAENGQLSGETINDLVQDYPELRDKISEVNGVQAIEVSLLEDVFKARQLQTTKGIQAEIDNTKATLAEVTERVGIRGIELESIEEISKARTEQAKDNERLAKEYIATGIPQLVEVGNELRRQAQLAVDSADVAEKVKKIKGLEAQLKSIKGNTLQDYLTVRDKKDSGGGGSKSLPNRILEDARYLDLTSQLENVNALLAKQKALLDGLADNEYDKKIEGMKKENELLEQKKEIITKISDEEKREKDELRSYLEDKNFTFDENGIITNGAEKLKEMTDYVNSMRGASQQTYDDVNSRYEETKRLFDRYADLIKDIPQLEVDYYGLDSEINKNLLKITDTDVAKKFDGIEKSIAVFDRALKDVDYKLELSTKDKIRQQELLAEKSVLYQNEIERETSLLEDLNRVTDENILNNETFIQKKLELVDSIKAKIAELNVLRDKEIEDSENAVRDAETRVIDIINKGLELKKKALDKELDMFNEYIDDKIKAMDRENEASDFQKDMDRELKDRQKIQDQINNYAFDTSLEGFQKRKELEEQLADIDEKINDKKTKRSRDIIKQGLQDQKDGKQKEKDNALNMLDEEFSESKKKLIAHDILVTESFDTIRAKFPELFNELDVSTSDFFGTFESYESKFGTVVGNFAKTFKETILPDLLLAVQALKDIEMGINNIDYKNFEFNKDFDYSAEINSLKAKGYKDDSPEIVELEKKRAAKIYSDPKLTAMYEQYIPIQYRQKKSTTSINQANAQLDKANENEPKPTKYTQSYYDRLYFDSSIDYSQEIINLLNKGYSEDSPEVVAMYEKKAGKIYSNENWRRLYENTLPYKYRISGSYASGINGGLINNTGTYLLHGTSTNPEWVLTNSQMFNLVKNMANNIPSLQANKGANMGDINLSINIQGNATNDVVGQIKSASVQVIHDIRRELNKSGIYK